LVLLKNAPNKPDQFFPNAPALEDIEHAFDRYVIEGILEVDGDPDI
jgi:hypothetical protein